MYGTITDPSAGGARVTYGVLNWTLQPSAGGTPIIVTGTVTNINDQFSYVLRVPCETEISGVPVSVGVLKLSSSPTGYDRSSVTVAGVPASFSLPSLTNLVLTSTDRGRIERIDLIVNLNAGGGLPDAWQIQYFGHTGVDPNADPDNDGMSNLAEYKAGTSPTDSQSRFVIMRVVPGAGGANQVDWSSVLGKFYTVQRSADLLGGFVDLQQHVAATPPLNSFVDGNALGEGPFFYRIRVE
jgi:hypothetical protein